MRSLSDVSQRQKTQIDSLKTRLAVVTKEKSDNEVKVVKLSDELDRKVRLKRWLTSPIILVLSGVDVMLLLKFYFLSAIFKG